MTTAIDDPAACVRRLGFAYADRALWTDLDFEVAQGEMLAVLGESGSGKTTLLQCIGGLETPTSGNVVVGGLDPTVLKGAQKRAFLRNIVGYAFQGAGVVASWTVKKNLEIAGFKVDSDPERVWDLFDRFDLPHDFMDRHVFKLSGGEQQRVALIRLGLQNPRLLLLDEPTAALDDDNAAHVVEFINTHCEQGGSAIVVTHDSRIATHASSSLRL